MTDCILAVDIGTSSLKIGLISMAGDVVSLEKARNIQTDAKFCGQSWLHTLRFAFNKIKNKSEYNILGMCISGNGPTVVTERGITVMWNQDTPLPIDFLEKEK